MNRSLEEPVPSLDELDDRKRRLRQLVIRVLLGLVCLCLAALIATALFCFNPKDPWSFSASNSHITNPLGFYGAEVSGHLEHRLGAGAWLVVIALLIWGIRGVMRIPLGAIPLRILSAIATIISGSTLFSMIGRGVFLSQNALTWGGICGTSLSRYLVYSFTHLAGPIAGKLLAGFTTLTFFLIALSLAFGFKINEWRIFFGLCFKASSHTFYGAKAMTSKIMAKKQGTTPKIKDSSSDKSASFTPYNSSSSSISFKEEPVSPSQQDKQTAVKESFLTRFNPFLKKNAPLQEDTSREQDSKNNNFSERVEPKVSSLNNTPDPKEAENDQALNGNPVVAEPKISIKQAPIAAEKTPREHFLERYKHDWKFPSPSLLEPPKPAANAQSEDELKEMAEKLDVSLKDYQIRGSVTKAHAGPVVTLYEVQLDRGEKKSRLLNAAVDISRDLEIDGEIRIIDLDGKSTLGVEVPNTHRQMIQFSSLLASQAWKDTKGTLPMILGVDIMGEPAIADLATMPHLLVAGATGAGKSVAINTMLTSLLYRLKPEECRLILIDPKIVELAVYHDLPHLLTPVLNDPNKVLGALTWAENEMNSRYDALKQHSVRNIAAYNQSIDDIKKGLKPGTRKVQSGFDQTGRPLTEEVALSLEKLPYIVIVIDEWADIYLQEGVGKKIEVSVNRLAAKARAAGIHIILATQRPSTDVLSGTIRNNFPARIAFRVSSNHDSRTIINTVGAENLLGKGDMLFKESAFKMPRLQGAFLSDMEVERVAQFLRDQRPPFYDQDIQAQIEATDDQAEGDRKPASLIKSEEDDEIYGKCLEIISNSSSISTSSLQRQLRLGYNRAANMIDRLEEEGYIGRPNGSKPRDVIKRPSSEDF